MDELAYFRELVTGDRRVEELRAFHGQVVGTLCNFVPEELIVALGAVPVRLCAGEPGAVAAGETILPRDICPTVKATAGLVQAGLGLHGRADALVIPTPCDAKKKLGAVLAPFKRVHVLDLPPRKDSPSAKAFWLAQIQELVRVLESWTGRTLTRPALRAAIELYNRREAAFRRLLELRRRDPTRLTGQALLFVTQASFTDDPARWTAQVEALCDALERQPAGAAPRARVLLTGAPLIWPNHKVVELLEAAGALVAADELCSGTQRLYQPVVLRDFSLPAMLEGLAERYLLPTTCPCFVDGQDRLNRVLELAAAHAVDGVVYHSLRLCPLFDIEALAMQQTLRERGLPMLQLNTDLSSEDTGQLRTRVEAFVELLTEPGGRRLA